MLGNLDGHHGSVGTDLSVRQIAHAQRTYGGRGIRFHTEPPERLPAELGPFDAITLIELIEHLNPVDVDETLSGALERLRPGGRVILTTPNFHSAWPLVEAAINRFGDLRYEHQHINRFTRARVYELLQRHGLAQPHVEPYLFLAPFAAAVGWRFADRVAALERRGVERRAGMLLLGTAIKPA
jgi:SAM-dependent methyltransferase